MTRYVRFDSNSKTPYPVTGWCDTSVYKYPDLPPISKNVPAGFLEVEDEVWQQHLNDLHNQFWFVENNKVSYKKTTIKKTNTKVLVPDTITLHQFQHVLHDTIDKKSNSNLFDAVNAYMITTDFKTKLAWDKANTISRTGDLVSKISDQFSLTNKQVDQIFITASKVIA